MEMSTPERGKRKNDERLPVTERERQNWEAMWRAEKSQDNLNTFIRDMRAELRGSDGTSTTISCSLLLYLNLNISSTQAKNSDDIYHQHCQYL